ncbi:MAG: sialate O-acetylesterase [Planctomycetia bacterium]
MDCLLVIAVAKDGLILPDPNSGDHLATSSGDGAGMTSGYFPAPFNSRKQFLSLFRGSGYPMTILSSRFVVTTVVAFAFLAMSTRAQDNTRRIPGANGKPADMNKPVQVFICLGQSNMVGLGKVTGGDNSLEYAVKEKKKYQYLVDDAGAWAERQDVRFVQYMSGKGPLKNEWMSVTAGNLGPEYGIGHPLGNAIDAPVMILKCCIGNRSLGWDLLPPGSERYRFVADQTIGKDEKPLVYAGYRDKPESWEMDVEKGLETEPAPWLDRNGKPIDWYAGKQWDSDIGDARKALADLEKHYPGAKGYEVVGFFFWQGEKDAGNPGHASRYETNLVHFIKSLRKEFNAPNAKFVLATMGESVKGSGGSGGKILQAQLAVDGATGTYPEFKGNVATIYTNPLAQGGSGNGHYGRKAEVYMDVGEAMGQTMVELLMGAE